MNQAAPTTGHRSPGQDTGSRGRPLSTTPNLWISKGLCLRARYHLLSLMASEEHLNGQYPKRARGHRHVLSRRSRGGRFLANRYSAAPAPPTTVAGPAESGPGGANPAEAAQPVHETEAVMDEGPRKQLLPPARRSRLPPPCLLRKSRTSGRRGSRRPPRPAAIDRWQRGSVLRPPRHARRLRPSGRESGCFASADRACRPLDARSAGGGRLSNRPATR